MGTLTRAEMRADLYLLLNSRDEVDASVAAGAARLDRFLQWSYARVQLPTVFRHVELQTAQTITLVTSTQSYALTLWAIDHVRYNNVPRLLQPMTREQLSMMTSVPGGPPTRFARWGTNLYTDYTPTSVQNGHTLTVYGWANTATLASTLAASVLHPVWDEVIVTGAAWRGWRSLGDHGRADMFREEYAALVQDNREVMAIEGHTDGWRTTVGGGQDY